MSSRPWYDSVYRLPSPKLGDIAAVEKELSEPESNTCEKCGLDFNSINPRNVWPFCKGKPEDHLIDHSFGFDYFEPYVDLHLPGGKDFGSNYSGEKGYGHFIDTRAKRQQVMKEQGIVSGGRSQHRNRHNAHKDYDKIAEGIATKAFAEWKRR